MSDSTRPVTAPLARTAGQTIDRDALVNVLIDLAQQAHYAGDADGWVVDLNPFADRVIALVEPVAGIVLTPEERDLTVIALTREAVRYEHDTYYANYADASELAVRCRALAARLEAVSDTRTGGVA